MRTRRSLAVVGDIRLRPNFNVGFPKQPPFSVATLVSLKPNPLGAVDGRPQQHPALCRQPILLWAVRSWRGSIGR